MMKIIDVNEKIFIMSALTNMSENSTLAKEVRTKNLYLKAKKSKPI